MERRRFFYAIDFDGTVVTNQFPDIGTVKNKTVRLMKELRAKGHCIIIWTCRGGKHLEDMKEYLRVQEIPYDYINENPENSFGDNTRKLYADYYVDDRAVNVDNIDILF